VRAKQGKLLRAEPIAQQMVQDKVRTRGVFTDLEREWTTWQSTDPDSPGRVDSSCVLIYGLIPEANEGAIVHPPLPQAPQPGQINRPGPANSAAAPTDGGSRSDAQEGHVSRSPPAHILMLNPLYAARQSSAHWCA
jgi:hypothetical protein